MANRVFLAAASVALLVSGVFDAQAGDRFRTETSQGFVYCRGGAENDCARFEGYIYVRHSGTDAAAGAFGPAPAEGRLYVHAGTDTLDR